jgi:hypothetical protein
LQEKDAIPLGEREDESLDTLELPAEKVLTTPSVRKMASDHKVCLSDRTLIEILSVKLGFNIIDKSTRCTRKWKRRTYLEGRYASAH